MRKIIFALVPAMMAAAPAWANQCLATRDILSFSQGNRHGAVVRTTGNRTYDVRFKGVCPYHINSHFVYQNWQYGRCLKPGDSLQIAGGGACVVQSVRARGAYPPGPPPPQRPLE